MHRKMGTASRMTAKHNSIGKFAMLGIVAMASFHVKANENDYEDSMMVMGEERKLEEEQLVPYWSLSDLGFFAES